jgi:proteic killer suppression protein
MAGAVSKRLWPTSDDYLHQEKPRAGGGRFSWWTAIQTCILWATAHPQEAVMIRSFAEKEAERIWSGLRSRKLPPDIQKRAADKLKLLEAAASLDDLKSPPGNRLHALRDDRAGQHSVSINDQWRICFVWKDGDVHDVEIVDYH